MKIKNVSQSTMHLSTKEGKIEFRPGMVIEASESLYNLVRGSIAVEVVEVKVSAEPAPIEKPVVKGTSNEKSKKSKK